MLGLVWRRLVGDLQLASLECEHQPALQREGGRAGAFWLLAVAESLSQDLTVLE